MSKANETDDKIVYWQHRQREAMQRLSYMMEPYFLGYFSAADCAYAKAWQQQHAMAYRQIVRWRGF
jgi:hypothetical protein